MTLTFSKLLKTNVEKMSVFRLSIMLMKTHELSRSLHDVDEKKGVVENRSDKWRVTKHGVQSPMSEVRGAGAQIANEHLNRFANFENRKSKISKGGQSEILRGAQDDSGTGRARSFAAAQDDRQAGRVGRRKNWQSRRPNPCVTHFPHRLSAVPGEKMNESVDFENR